MCPVVAQDCRVVKAMVYNLLFQATRIMLGVDRADERDVHNLLIKGGNRYRGIHVVRRGRRVSKDDCAISIGGAACQLDKAKEVSDMSN
jgi:hypothetical protein